VPDTFPNFGGGFGKPEQLAIFGVYDALPALMATSVVICMIGIALPFTWLGASLGFVPLPALYWPAVIAIIGCYAALTHCVKTWLVRRWGM